MTPPSSRREAGFSLVGALAGITIMLTLMAMAMPAWRYVMQDSREEELIFRGTQIVEAIERCQQEKKGGAPVSLEMLVKSKCLRKAYTDPMTKDGKWRLIHPGEGILPGAKGAGMRPGVGGTGSATGGGASGKPSGGLGPGAMDIGPIIGVASRSKEKSLRMFNGRTQYDEWLFAVGMPRYIGKPPVNMPGGKGLPLPSPGPGGKGTGSGSPKR